MNENDKENDVNKNEDYDKKMKDKDLENDKLAHANALSTTALVKADNNEEKLLK